MTQKFKYGDATEAKFEAAATVIMDGLSAQKDLFFEDAYLSQPLGDILYESNRSPLANAIKQEIYRESFSTIFDAFVVSGSFESYLTVFRKIFGDDVDVSFTVPAAGKLQIDIIAQDVVLYDFVSRYISENQYFFENVIYEDDDGTGNLEFQIIKGFQSQYELEQMLFELVPAGIFTEISLELG